MNTTELEAAVKPLVLAGRKLLPLHYMRKNPIRNEWWKALQKRDNDQQLSNLYNTYVDRKQCNFGMAIGHASGLICIDLDYAKHPKAKDFYEEWKVELGHGIKVVTGGGEHYYFKHPHLDSGKLIKTAIGMMHEGVDLMGDTSQDADPNYTIIPPSVHESGKAYAYDNDMGETLADDAPDLPPRLRAFITDRNFWPVKESAIKQGNFKTAEEIAAYYDENPDAMFKADPFSGDPIEEGSRNVQLAAIAGKLLYYNSMDENYTVDDLKEAMYEVNENRCDPPMDDGEINVICNSVFKTRNRKEKARANKVKQAMSFETPDQPTEVPNVDPTQYKLTAETDDPSRADANIISQDELSLTGNMIGGAITQASTVECPDERPDAKKDPNQAAIWLLHQPPYKPVVEGADFNLIKLDNAFYQYSSNVWCKVSDASVKNNIQNTFLDAKRAHVENVFAFLKNWLYYPVKSMPFWKTGKPPEPLNGITYPDDPRKLILFNNGVFDVEHYLLTNGDKHTSLKPFHPNLFTTIKLRYNYDADAKCPEWIGFLRSIWDSEDSDRSLALKEWMGHCMIPDTSQHKIGLLHGVSRGGKSTVQTVTQHLVGEENTVSTNFGSLTTDHGLSPLVGKSLAIIPDAHTPKGTGDRAIELMKSISGGDPQQVNQKFMDQYTVKLTTRFMLVCNEMPHLPDSGNALLARLIPFYFEHMFHTPERQGRNDLLSVLLAELAGIANWAIEGILAYVSRGSLMMPREGIEDIARLKRTLNPVGAFADDLLIKDGMTWTPIQTLYDAWLDWAADAGMINTGTKDKLLGKLRIVVSPRREARRAGVISWQGVTINEAALKGLQESYNESEEF